MLHARHPRFRTRRLIGVALLCALGASGGCEQSGSSGNSNSQVSGRGNLNSSATTLGYSLRATVSGLISSGLVLQVDAMTVGVSAEATRQLATGMPTSSGPVLQGNSKSVKVAAGVSTELLVSGLIIGSTYSVTVQAQPTGQACSVANGIGTIRTANVTDVAVSCTDQSYSVAGTIAGLTDSGLVLANGSDTLVVSAGASTFTMPTAVAYGSAYDVTVQRQPVGLTCTPTNGSGTMSSAAVTNIAVSCAPDTYTVGGSISGLTAGGLVLLDNGGDALTVSANATQFTMGTPVAFGTPYAITVQTAPPGLVCTVSNGAGPMGAGGVTNITVACAPNFTLLHSFAGGTGDGDDPYHSLILAGNGEFYGSTLYGGTSNGGTIYQVSSSGTESLLYSFPSIPWAAMTQASDGNFYGTTAGGGTAGRGTFFELTPGGTETVLFSFPSGASDPYCGVIQGSDGNFYGTTGAGGSNDEGTVFEITTAGVETLLHSFPETTTTDGQQPYAGVIQGSDGNFYGTTYFGGTDDDGTVFKVTPEGTETVLYSFAGGTSDGANPYSGLIQGSDGNFYGTTYSGGAHGVGTVYRITSSGTETVVYSFSGGTGDGANPEAGVIQGHDGNFYGSTVIGGASNLGTVFEVTPSGVETVLHSFAGGAGDGDGPTANLVQGSDGSLYGSTGSGGASNDGTFFRVALQ